jgi:hypothetical protein
MRFEVSQFDPDKTNGENKKANQANGIRLRGVEPFGSFKPGNAELETRWHAARDDNIRVARA